MDGIFNIGTMLPSQINETGKNANKVKVDERRHLSFSRSRTATKGNWVSTSQDQPLPVLGLVAPAGDRPIEFPFSFETLRVSPCTSNRANTGSYIEYMFLIDTDVRIPKQRCSF